MKFILEYLAWHRAEVYPAPNTIVAHYIYRSRKVPNQLILLACAGLTISAPANAAKSQTSEARPRAGFAQVAAVPYSALVGTSRPILHPTNPDRRGEADEMLQLSEADLRSYRAGASIVTSNQTLTAISSGNVLTGNYVAGNITLSDNALSNFDGIGNFAINTGAQVSLQSGMNLTINVER